jgi:exodeoxyribonuclease VII large subunit
VKTDMLTLTVEELNEYVRKSLAGDPMLRGLRLKGELSNFKRHVSGHWYFTLKDSQSAVNCVMFRSAAASVGFSPGDGQRVVLRGSVGLYVKTGTYQFYAEGMEQDGMGELYLRMEALKNKLAGEGLFDAALKKPLPLLPSGIGIITSGTGAVIHDIARVAWRRDPGMPLYLYPAAVQGEGAAEQIARALQVMDRLDGVDVIIVGRGGGSVEDLWPFNEETVARAIAACHKPVVSAVGHETDFTIADFVADLRAPTPSAAAELAVSSRNALAAEITKLRIRLSRAGFAAAAEKEAALAGLQSRLTERSPVNRLRLATERSAALSAKIAMLCQTQFVMLEGRLGTAVARVNAAGPQATLQRGYALVKQNGKAVSGVAKLDAEYPFTVVLRDGWIDAKANRVVKGREEQP